MDLEFAGTGSESEEHYQLPLISRGATSMIDWSPMVAAILADVKRNLAAGEISAKFHNALVEALVAVARKIDCPRVALSGGCFQNRRLTERAVRRLRAEGFQPFWHQHVPTNDGGIALGQAFAARHGLTLRS